MGRLIALTLALAAAALIAWSQLRLPPAAGAQAPAMAFSATRALTTIRALDATPHPIGSAANHRVRDGLLARMTVLGMAPRVSTGDVLEPARPGALDGGAPQSLIGVLPGRDRTQPAVALMAHYDSRPAAPGAADDGAGVAAALEIVRAIRAEGPAARDLMVILTDGEEACLCGARQVFAQDPAARRIGLVLNLEARGSTGRALMFQTAAQDGGDVAFFREHAVRPATGSLFGAVYERLPNDTDFSISRAAGIGGFNFAFTGGAFDYHSPTDTPAHLDPRALQDMGNQALALARAAVRAPSLPPRRPDAVFAMLLGDLVVAYPPAWGWLLLAAAAALIAAGLLRARREGEMSALEVARGAAALAYAALGAFAVLRLAHLGATIGEPMGGFRHLLAQPARWEAAQLLLASGFLLFAAAETARGRRGPAALVPLACGLLACALARRLDLAGLGAGVAAALLALAVARGPVRRAGAWAGVLLAGLALAIAAQAAAPLAAYVLAWPLLVAAAGAAAAGLAAERAPWRLAVLAGAAALAGGWSAMHAHLIAVVVGRPELLVLPLVTAALALWPLAQPDAGAPPARLPGRLLLLAGAALTLFVRLAEPWDARHPQASFVAYQLDQDAGRAWRLAAPARRTAWSDAVLRAEGGRIGRLAHWAWDTPMDAAPARLAPVPPPTLSVTRAGDGLVRLRVRPAAAARSLALELAPEAPMRLLAVGAATADVDLAPGRWTRLDWAAPPADGLTLTLRPQAPGRLKLRYLVTLDGWPAGVAPPRPPPAAVMGLGLSGEALVTGSRTLAW